VEIMTTALDRHAAERGLIGCLLYSPEIAVPRCCGIAPDAFSAPDARIVYKAILANPSADFNAIRDAVGPELLKFAEMCIDESEPKNLAEYIREVSRPVEPQAPDDGTLDIEAILAAPVPPAECLLQNICEAGDLGDLISGSKDGKSFFAIGLGLHLAAGRDFNGIRIPKAAAVLYVNPEIRPKHFARRLHLLCTSYKMTADDLRGRFFVFHARGLGGDEIRAALPKLVKRRGAALVILDGLYRLLPAGADENLARDMGPVMAELLSLGETTGAAVLVVHHDRKGGANADNRTQDRGSGSGVVGRANDFRIVLTRARDDESATVVEILPRNFAAPDPFSVRFDCGAFVPAGEVQAIPQTAQDRRNRLAKVDRGPIEDHAATVMDLLSKAAMDAARFRPKVHRIVETEARVREIIATLEAAGRLEKLTERGRGINRVTYGTPEQIAELRQGRLSLNAKD
jgi:hypothetical protein